MNSNFSFKIFNQLEEKLKEDWLSLEQNSNFLFFQKYYYAKNLIEVFKINLFFIAVVYDKNKPVAIFPLEIKSYKKVKILQWLGSNQSDYCCPIIKNDIFKDHQKFEFIWKEILKEIENFDIIFLNKQPEYVEKTLNPFVQFLKNVFHSKVYQIDLTKIDDNLSYIKNNKFISEFKRTKKKLTENYQVEFQNYFLANQTDLIDRIIKKKISYLEKKRISHSVSSDFINLNKKLSITYPDKLVAGVLKINNEIVAANIGIIENRRFYYLVPVVFSDKYSSFSPGKLLIYKLLSWSKNNEVDTFDFGIGDEIYKKYWSNYSTRIFRHIDYKGTKGLIFYFIIKLYLKMKEIFKNFKL